MQTIAGEGEKERFEQRIEEIDTLTERVIGAAIAVHRALGPGLSESVYAKAMALELTALDIPFAREVCADITYRSIMIGEGRADLVVDHRLIVELKAVETLLAVHSAQVIAYLKMLNLPAGLIINFQVAKLAHGVRRLNHPDRHRLIIPSSCPDAPTS